MDIDVNSLEIAKSLYNQHEEVRTLKKEDLSLFLNNRDSCNNDNISLIADIVCAIKSAQELAIDSDYDKILACLCSGSITFKSKYYLAYVLVSDYSINPFGLLSSINTKDLYYNVRHFFKNTFDICPITDSIIITKYLKKVFDLTKNNINQGQIISEFDKYLKKDFQINKEILKVFYNTPEEYLLWGSVFALENILIVELDSFNYWIDTFLESNFELHLCCATICCKNILRDNSEISVSKVELISLKCQSNLNERFIGNAMQLFYQLLECDSVSDEMAQDLKTIILTNIRKSDVYKYYLSGELSRSTSLNDFKIVLLNELFLTKIGENLGLIQELDHIAYYLIEDGCLSTIWELLKQFYVLNSSKMKTTEFSEIFKLTFDIITSNNSSCLIPKIYECFASSVFDINFAMQFINYIVFIKSYQNVNWLQGIDSSHILKIIKLLTVNCFEANFICFIGLKYLEITLPDVVFEEYQNFYLESICKNYSEPSFKISIEYPNPNSQQKAIIEMIAMYHKNNKEKYKLIESIKDLDYSKQRIMQFQLEKAKFSEKIVEQGQNKSVFFALLSNHTIKYGIRHGIIQNMDGIFVLSENTFSSFGGSFEVPFKYLNDAISFQLEKTEAYGNEVNE